LRARFSYAPFSAERTLAIAESVLASVKARIASAMDVSDQPAPALKKTKKGKDSYAKFKIRIGAKPIRDWFLTGQTMRSLKVSAYGPGKAIISFTTPEAQKRAYINNRRHRQFGLSQKDKQVLLRSINEQFRVIAQRAT
jgi:hypothetical protein